ncbi:MAG: hypothetical protein AUH36_03670 [Chloroflexi bacterium 13_1_40CM_55_7]|nr:MAG: hypothetical protein AUH36_03670 [Chloroflexi bacterium 13_1_40CM_55_7]
MAISDHALASSLPANVEAERSILGAILLDNFAYNQAAEHLRPEDFSLDSHRRIYTRMVDLAESSRPIDMITLVEELDRRKELEAIGDVGYISGLVDGLAPSGKLLVPAAPLEPLSINVFSLITKRSSVAGWYSGTAKDSQDTLEFNKKQLPAFLLVRGRRPDWRLTIRIWMK